MTCVNVMFLQIFVIGDMLFFFAFFYSSKSNTYCDCYNTSNDSLIYFQVLEEMLSEKVWETLQHGMLLTLPLSLVSLKEKTKTILRALIWINCNFIFWKILILILAVICINVALKSWPQPSVRWRPSNIFFDRHWYVWH